MRKALGSRAAVERQAYDPYEEIKYYFGSPLELETVDPVAWWGVCLSLFEISDFCSCFLLSATFLRVSYTLLDG